MTRLMGVQPAVDLSWKALIYSDRVKGLYHALNNAEIGLDSRES